MNNMLRSKVEALQGELQDAEEWPIKYREMHLRSEMRDWLLCPLKGFTVDVSPDLLSWVCGIPGKAGTLHEGAMYELTLEFGYQPAASARSRSKALFPFRPPRALLPPCFFHPNVYPSGELALPLLADEKVWDSSITIKEILLSVQEFLSRHNLTAPVQEGPWQLANSDPRAYLQRLSKQAEQRRRKSEDDSQSQPQREPATPDLKRNSSSLRIITSGGVLESPGAFSPQEKHPSPDLLRPSESGHPEQSPSLPSLPQPALTPSRSSSAPSPQAHAKEERHSAHAGSLRPTGQWVIRDGQRIYIYGLSIE
jgi:ubiquitin-conjugating enzyme E2 I